MTLRTTLCRDKVISIVNGKNLVGLYLKENPKKLLLECDPQKADKLIALWNKTNVRQAPDTIVKFFITVCNSIRNEYEQDGIIGDFVGKDFKKRDLNKDVLILKKLLTKF